MEKRLASILVATIVLGSLVFIIEKVQDTNVENNSEEVVSVIEELDIRKERLDYDVWNIGGPGEIIVDEKYVVGLQIDEETTSYDEVRIWSSEGPVDFSSMSNEFLLTDEYEELGNAYMESTYEKGVSGDVMHYSKLSAITGAFMYGVMQYTTGNTDVGDLEDLVDEIIIYSDVNTFKLSNGTEASYIHQDIDLGNVFNRFIEDEDKKATSLVVRMTYISIPDQRSNGNYIQIGISSGISDELEDNSISLTGKNDLDFGNVSTVVLQNDEIEKIAQELMSELIYFELDSVKYSWAK